ncbi:hypothetical protein FQA39_LY15758 [Lamprigera yunnana]|nr:hypothetical protein FQA39_LY15758 [Lamprigera yunnana]
MSQKYHEDIVNSKLENKQTMDRVSELVRLRLVECGWCDQVRLACRRLCTDAEEPLTSVDEFTAIVTPSARAMVPDSVKRELLHELELILTEKTFKK